MPPKKMSKAEKAKRERAAQHGHHEWLPKAKYNNPDYCPGPVTIIKPKDDHARQAPSPADQE